MRMLFALGAGLITGAAAMVYLSTKIVERAMREDEFYEDLFSDPSREGKVTYIDPKRHGDHSVKPWKGYQEGKVNYIHEETDLPSQEELDAIMPEDMTSEYDPNEYLI